MVRTSVLAVMFVLFAGFCAPQTLSKAQEPKPGPQPSKDGAVAKISGPSEAHVGQQLKYSTEGSQGSDIQFSISPPTIGFEPVKLMDGKDTPGVIFTPGRAGTYYLYVMLNNNGKTGFTLLVLTVTGPTPSNPDVVPDKVYFNIKDSLKTDRDADAQAGQSVAQLESLFQQWGTMADASTSWDQFNKTFKDAASSSLGDKLPATRKAIAAYIKTRFPSDASADYSKSLVKAVAAEILQTIKLSK